MAGYNKQKNVDEFYYNLEKFRLAARYTDLTIECEDSYFQCHRVILAAASDFFDCMLAGTFRERKEEHIKIREVSATTLGEVLRFVYTGYTQVTCANVCDLYKASKFFDLTGIADLCFDFVRMNKMTVNTTLKMYRLAYEDNDEKLIDVLSQDIADQLKIFARTRLFLGISFKGLKLILDKRATSSSVPMNAEDGSLDAICRWFLHCREKRSVYLEQLYGMIHFESVSADVAKFVISKLSHQSRNAIRTQNVVDPIGSDEFIAFSRSTASSFEYPTQTLHLYIKWAGENSVKVLSINQCNKKSISEVHLKHTSQSIRTVALDYYLYSLHYNGRGNIETEDNYKRQTFCVYTSANMQSSRMELNAPPIMFGDVSLCRGQNDRIYAYNQTLDRELIKTGSRCSAMFTDDEMDRGIYLYHADLDTWLPVPAMPKRVRDACMVTCDGLLYLIGGINCIVQDHEANTVQIYDQREGMWQLWQDRTVHNRVGADCCMYDGTIYVGGGNCHGTTVECYDPAMRRWLVCDAKTKTGIQYHRLVAYNRKLWAVGSINSSIKPVQSELVVQTYPNDDFSLRPWDEWTQNCYDNDEDSHHDDDEYANNSYTDGNDCTNYCWQTKYLREEFPKECIVLDSIVF